MAGHAKEKTNKRAVFLYYLQKGDDKKKKKVNSWISRDERNKAWGSSRWKNSIKSHEVRTVHWLWHSHIHTHNTHSRCTQDFQFAIRPSAVNPPCSPAPSLAFGIKVPPRHESQILYDIVEIALSKMQSAKAASSADELLWLKERQWLVIFAMTGPGEGQCTESGGVTWTAEWMDWMIPLAQTKPRDKVERVCQSVRRAKIPLKKTKCKMWC